MNKTTDQNLPETPDIESSSDDYARRFDGAVGRWFLKVQEDATLTCLKPHSGKTILDVGGGHGQTLDALIRNEYRVTVLGSSEDCALRIRSFLDTEQAEFRCGNLVDLPFEDNSFDWTISYRMLTHLREWRRLIAELCRVSRKGVIVDFPSRRSVNVISSALFFVKKGIEKNTRPYQLFSESSIVHEFKAHAFSPATRQPQFFFPMALHRFAGNIHFSKFTEGCSRLTGLSALFGSPVIYSFIAS